MVTLASDGALTKASEGGTMKKVLAAAICGGVLMFFVPQVASGSETTGGGNDRGCATMTQGSPDQPKQDAPGEGRSHYDKKHHDDDAVLN